MRNSIAQGLFGAILQLQPLPWDDSNKGTFYDSFYRYTFFWLFCFLNGGASLIQSRRDFTTALHACYHREVYLFLAKKCFE